jgi:hypothetical protein
MPSSSSVASERSGSASAARRASRSRRSSSRRCASMIASGSASHARRTGSKLHPGLYIEDVIFEPDAPDDARTLTAHAMWPGAWTALRRS